MPENEPLPVEFDELMAAEFDYIAQTAIQANEDRARVSSFYMVAVGSLVAALFGTQFFDPSSPSPTVYWMFSGLFVLLTLLGTSTVMQLARLRGAWFESALAMNQIKAYMIDENPRLADAFRWQASTLPSKHKTNSVSYYQATEVALISGLTFGAAVFFLQRAVAPLNGWQWLLAIVSGIAAILVQLRVYWRALN
jgi:hypothetical protein